MSNMVYSTRIKHPCLRRQCMLRDHLNTNKAICCWWKRDTRIRCSRFHGTSCWRWLQLRCEKSEELLNLILWETTKHILNIRSLVLGNRRRTTSNLSSHCWKRVRLILRFEFGNEAWKKAMLFIEMFNNMSRTLIEWTNSLFIHQWRNFRDLKRRWRSCNRRESLLTTSWSKIL